MVGRTFSNLDLATTISFTDDPLVPGTTIIKRVHILELQAAVNVVRKAGGLDEVSFTDGLLMGVTIKLIHVNELRMALDAARRRLNLPPLHYTDISIGSVVGAADFTELRNGVK